MSVACAALYASCRNPSIPHAQRAETPVLARGAAALCAAPPGPQPRRRADLGGPVSRRCSVAMYWLLDVSYLLVLAVAVPAAGSWCAPTSSSTTARTGRSSPERANAVAGHTLGLVVCTPFQAGATTHAVHHATSGDLDRRGVGRRPDLTVAEYEREPRLGPPRLPPVPQPVGDVRARADLGDRRPAAHGRRVGARAAAQQRGGAPTWRCSSSSGDRWLIGWQAFLLV